MERRGDRLRGALQAPRLASKARAFATAHREARIPAASGWPGAALAMLLAAYHVAVPPATAASTVITVADAGCGPLASMPSYDWPQGAVVLAPPVLGVRLLAAEQHPAVVATLEHYTDVADVHANLPDIALISSTLLAKP